MARTQTSWRLCKFLTSRFLKLWQIWSQNIEDSEVHLKAKNRPIRLDTISDKKQLNSQSWHKHFFATSKYNLVERIRTCALPLFTAEYDGNFVVISSCIIEYANERKQEGHVLLFQCAFIKGTACKVGTWISSKSSLICMNFI